MLIRAKYKADSDSYKARSKKYQDIRRARIHEAKSVPCADCLVSYPPYVMDFDHVRGTKDFNIGAEGLFISSDKLEAEIAKCDVVCANCHRERTNHRVMHRSMMPNANPREVSVYDGSAEDCDICKVEE